MHLLDDYTLPSPFSFDPTPAPLPSVQGYAPEQPAFPELLLPSYDEIFNPVEPGIAGSAPLFAGMF